MEVKATKYAGIHALILVFTSVILGIISAYILKEASLHNDIGASVLVLTILAVVLVNGLRFVVWWYVHKRFPLSSSYPLSSLFFPLILIMGYAYGEEITSTKIIGAGIIVIGVALMTHENSRG